MFYCMFYFTCDRSFMHIRKPSINDDDDDDDDDDVTMILIIVSGSKRT